MAKSKKKGKVKRKKKPKDSKRKKAAKAGLLFIGGIAALSAASTISKGLKK